MVVLWSGHLSARIRSRPDDSVLKLPSSCQVVGVFSLPALLCVRTADLDIHGSESLPASAAVACLLSPSLFWPLESQMRLLFIHPMSIFNTVCVCMWTILELNFMAKETHSWAGTKAHSLHCLRSVAALTGLLGGEVNAILWQKRSQRPPDHRLASLTKHHILFSAWRLKENSRIDPQNGNSPLAI